MAAVVCLPIAPSGAVRSMRGSLSVREVSASMEIWRPGPITPPRYSPAPETTSKLVEVPKSTATHAPLTLAWAATAFTRRSAPSSCGLSTRIGIPVFRLGPTSRHGWPMCRSVSASYSGPSCGTTVDTIAPSSDPKPRSSSASRWEIVAASSSAVALGIVPSRQSRLRSSPSKAPMCVCVLPTSTASSMRGIITTPIGCAAMAEAKLYVIPGSHPSRGAMLMLERKGIPYKRVDLMPVISKGALRAMRFPLNTVPALKLDGSRVQGSREIARELDRIQPDPPLLPSDPDQRAEVEEAEAWGDGFQQKPRALSWWAFKRDRAPMASYSEGARLGIPVGLAVKTGGPLVAVAARLNDSPTRM